MDTTKLLDQLLSSAKDMASKGRETAETKLGIPEQGPERDTMLSGMGKGAMAAGALALLLGTGAGRRLTGSALKLGSLAAIGAVGYKAYQNWQGKQQQQPDINWDLSNVKSNLESQSQDKSLVLLKAMIAAANADGHIDYRERTQIESQMTKLGFESEVADLIREQLDNPADANTIASLADNNESATEIYLATRLLIDDNNQQEKAYLDQLTAALGLPADLVSELEAQINA